MIKHQPRELTVWFPAKNKSKRSMNSNIQAFSGGECHQTLPQHCLSRVFSRLQSLFSQLYSNLLKPLHKVVYTISDHYNMTKFQTF